MHPPDGGPAGPQEMQVAEPRSR